MAENQKTYIEKARKNSGLKIKELAELIGVSPQHLGMMERGERSVSAVTLKKIAIATETTANFLLNGSDASVVYKQNNPALSAPDDTKRDLPVMGVAMGSLGEYGEFQLADSPADYVQRPKRLINITDAYALTVRGTSMVPAFNDGDLIFVHPGIPPQPGDHIVVHEKKHAKDNTTIYIKKFLACDDNEIFTKQYNPDAKITFKRSVVPEMHKILTLRELFT